MIDFDPVEFVMQCEDTFGITIPNTEAKEIQTPNELCDYICSKLTLTDDSGCQSQKAFYLLRRTLTEHTDARRSDIHPDTEINRLLPTDNAGEIWPVLETSAEVRRWPVLKRPLWLKLCLLGLVGFIAFLFFTLCRVFSLPTWGLAVLAVTLLPAVLVVVALCVEQYTRHMRNLVPSSIQRVKDLIPYAKSSEQINWTRPQAAAMIKELILDMIGGNERNYKENGRFDNYYCTFG